MPTWNPNLPNFKLINQEKAQRRKVGFGSEAESNGWGFPTYHAYCQGVFFEFSPAPLFQNPLDLIECGTRSALTR